MVKPIQTKVWQIENTSQAKKPLLLDSIGKWGPVAVSGERLRELREDHCRQQLSQKALTNLLIQQRISRAKPRIEASYGSTAADEFGFIGANWPFRFTIGAVVD